LAALFLTLFACAETPGETSLPPGGQTGVACPPPPTADGAARIVHQPSEPHDVSDAGADAPSAELQAHCETLCRRSLDCRQVTDVPACVERCVARLASYREDAVAMVTACLVAGGCQADERRCISMIRPLEIHLTYAQACRDKGAECGWDCDQIESRCNVQGGALASNYLLYPPSRMQTGIACLRNPCDRICLLPIPRRPTFP
jgi:hypothetical protein